MTHRVFNASNVFGTIAFLAMIAAPGAVEGGMYITAAVLVVLFAVCAYISIRIHLHPGGRERRIGPTASDDAWSLEKIIHVPIIRVRKGAVKWEMMERKKYLGNYSRFRKGEKGMAFRICEHCGAHLDPGEACDCREEDTPAEGCRSGTGTVPYIGNPYKQEKEEVSDVIGEEH